MKTIIEILDELAERANYVSFRSAMMATIDESIKMIEEAADIYANQSKWISCAEKLPENRTFVLTFSPNYKKLAEFKHGCFFDGLERLFNVTYWQPLPENP